MPDLNVHQVYIANPSDFVQPNALIYLGLSPYGSGDDSAILFSNLQAQICPSVLDLDDNYSIPNLPAGSPPIKRTFNLTAGGDKTVIAPTAPVNGEELQFINLYAGADFFAIALPDGLELNGFIFPGVSDIGTLLSEYIQLTTGTTLFQPVDITKTGQRLLLKWCAAPGLWLIDSNVGYDIGP